MYIVCQGCSILSPCGKHLLTGGQKINGDLEPHVVEELLRDRKIKKVHHEEADAYVPLPPGTTKPETITQIGAHQEDAVDREQGAVTIQESGQQITNTIPNDPLAPVTTSTVSNEPSPQQPQGSPEGKWVYDPTVLEQYNLDQLNVTIQDRLDPEEAKNFVPFTDKGQAISFMSQHFRSTNVATG